MPFSTTTTGRIYMMRTPRQNKTQREHNDAVNYANGALFAPAKEGTTFATNRESLVKNSALKIVADNARALEDTILSETQSSRP